MPIYEYHCRSCNHSFDKYLKMDNRKVPESEPCPNCQKLEVYQGVSAIPLADSVNIGVTRPPGGFRDVLQKIHERTPGSNLNRTSQLTRL